MSACPHVCSAYSAGAVVYPQQLMASPGAGGTGNYVKNVPYVVTVLRTVHSWMRVPRVTAAFGGAAVWALRLPAGGGDRWVLRTHRAHVKHRHLPGMLLQSPAAIVSACLVG